MSLSSTDSQLGRHSHPSAKGTQRFFLGVHALLASLRRQHQLPPPNAPQRKHSAEQRPKQRTRRH